MSESKKPIELSEQAELESLAKTIQTLQRATNRALRRRGLTGDEFHPLVVIDIGLFNLMCIARLAAGTFGKENSNEEKSQTGQEEHQAAGADTGAEAGEEERRDH